ncbi:MAG: hypothetical protein M1812_003201 [Candelaria pacifica]|nr:MAG: hypothetical protein M1812_003201 [Candelaria pacifica]
MSNSSDVIVEGMESFSQLEMSSRTDSSYSIPFSHSSLPLTNAKQYEYNRPSPLNPQLDVFEKDAETAHLLGPLLMYNGSHGMDTGVTGSGDGGFAPSNHEWYRQGNDNEAQEFDIYKHEQCASRDKIYSEVFPRSYNSKIKVSHQMSPKEGEHHPTKASLQAGLDLENHAVSNSTSPSPLRSRTPPISSSKRMGRSSLRTKADNAFSLPISNFRAKTSIPSQLTAQEYARQCILAAYTSRLSPFALHPDEYKLLKTHLTQSQVTTYLNIRNGILRLWTRNSLVSVTREEAAGCAKDDRWLAAADVAYEWLVRNGYINFGCVVVPDTTSISGNFQGSDTRHRPRKTVVVVGAGMAGLGCARQLEGLFSQFAERWTAVDEEVPKVIVLEGRARIGGRVYSHPLRTQRAGNLPNESRCTAELGAHIITGFDHGNPLSILIRGQLALRYHALKDNSILYDTNGIPVDKERDVRVEKLYNDILDRASNYRHRSLLRPTIEGDRVLIEQGRDSLCEGGVTISEVEQSALLQPLREKEQVPIGVDKLTGRAYTAAGQPSKVPAAEAARAMGWHVKPGVEPTQTVILDDRAKSSQHPSLGAVMDDAVRQYQDILELDSKDLRLLNWHYANLEYANAANVGELSLGGWDQDTGNEFEGHHAQVIGGYLQVPRAIWQSPTQLDVRTRKVVTEVLYDVDESTASTRTAKVICEDEEVIKADQVVMTVPLGILKEKSVQFEPTLPCWKSGPIARLGYGTLNKVILVYKEAFWDRDRDMFGLLREPENEGSSQQQHYISSRGRFYLFWNCLRTSGQPTLIALMAGEAAHQTENSEDDDLVSEVTESLRKVFSPSHVPEPSEVIITRWGKDRFARGSYSYMGVEAQPEDYDAMARPIGNLHFAGEATCGTHPATVHGAYISGLRAASEVIESILGPLKIPSPLISPKPESEPVPVFQSRKRKAHEPVLDNSAALLDAQNKTQEGIIQGAIYSTIGWRPLKPSKSGVNPFLLYQKDHWQFCKARCEASHRNATQNSEAGSHRNDVRAALGKMWKNATEEEQKPYLQQAAVNRVANIASKAEFYEKLKQWDEDAAAIREQFNEHNADALNVEPRVVLPEKEIRESDRRVKKLSGYAESSSSLSDLTDWA